MLSGGEGGRGGRHTLQTESGLQREGERLRLPSISALSLEQYQENKNLRGEK
jgi:hypothetical protein